MTVQDRDNWPAYAGLVIGETGEYSRWLTTDGVLIPPATAIVGLTLLRHYLDRSCESPFEYLVALTAKSRSLADPHCSLVRIRDRSRGTLLTTLYRDGECTDT